MLSTQSQGNHVAHILNHRILWSPQDTLTASHYGCLVQPTRHSTMHLPSGFIVYEKKVGTTLLPGVRNVSALTLWRYGQDVEMCEM